jgi:hypothetical protein
MREYRVWKEFEDIWAEWLPGGTVITAIVRPESSGLRRDSHGASSFWEKWVLWLARRPAAGSNPQLFHKMGSLFPKSGVLFEEAKWRTGEIIAASIAAAEAPFAAGVDTIKLER